MAIWNCSCEARKTLVWAPAPIATSSELAPASAAGPSTALLRASSLVHPPWLSRLRPAPGSAHQHPLLAHNNALSGMTPNACYMVSPR